MILVTVGSSSFPFQRLMDELTTLAPEELIVQHGPAVPPPGVGVAIPYLPFAQLYEHMERADAIVAHGGTGSILLSHRAGHIPVVVPRLKRFGETVDDHQVQLAAALAARGSIVAVTDLGRLRAAFDARPAGPAAAAANGAAELRSAVRRAILAPR